MNRLMVQRFQVEHADLKETFAIVRSTPKESQTNESAVEFVDSILSKVAMRNVKVITSYSRIDAIEDHTFTGPNGNTVKVDTIINRNKQDDNFKKI